MRKPIATAVLALGLFGSVLAACAAESTSAKTPAGATSGEAAPTTIGEARGELGAREHDFEMAGSDCEKACKALASLERAANHLCMLSEPDECADARARVDRARRAVTAQCGGC